MKRVYAGGMAVLLSTAISMNSLAAGWYQEETNWKYQKVDNQKEAGSGWMETRTASWNVIILMPMETC